MGINIDWSISVGNIVTIASVFIAFGTWLWRSGGKSEKTDMAIEKLEEGFEKLEKNVEKIADAVIQVSVQKVQIDSLQMQYALMDKKFEDLRRGQGFVIARPFGAESER